MCWICERLEVLSASWSEESEFQGQTSTDYHRGMAKGFHECSKDLSEAVAALRLKGICGKFPEYEGTLSDKQRGDILDDILKLRDEEESQE